jgi:chondroitin AC lyase
MFDGLVICLGTGISSKTGLKVTTGINQTFLNGEVQLKTNSGISTITRKQSQHSPSWIIHDGIGYLFPAGGNLVIQAEQVEGSWNWVAKQYPEEIIEADLFRLWLDHGTDPAGASYEYILVPGADREKLEGLKKNLPFEIRNDPEVQAVAAKDGSFQGMVFYRDGKLEGDMGIEADRPCLLMMKKKGDGIQISVAEPTQLLPEIRIALTGKYEHDYAIQKNGRTTLTVPLPRGEKAGSSITMDLRPG